MIQYSLKCAHGHSFESWFKSADSFETLRKSGHLSCTVCGGTDVSKALMAPRVRPARDKSVAAPVPAKSVAPDPHVPDEKVARALGELRKKVESNSDYVGGNFAKEARDMHLGETPDRAIYGEANLSEVKGLVEDGVPILPLPFTPTRKVN